ncbi:hypothetical protein Q8F55_007524 [Vanrija albida]|uniref:Uncharacterized protein n=1 Tax=Vanrija albida TaxID=181172 RepID=A0ABR3PTS2_9TREE
MGSSSMAVDVDTQSATYVPYPTPPLDQPTCGLFGPAATAPAPAFPPSPSFSTSLARRSASPPPRSARAPPAPLLLSAEWAPVELADDPAVPSPSLLRAPRIAPRELALSPTTRSWDNSRAATPVRVPVEGTRPPAAPRYSALGLEIAACAARSPASPRKRRLGPDVEERAVAPRREEDDERIAHWWLVVAASGASTPPRAPTPCAQAWGHELSAALSRLEDKREWCAVRCEPLVRTPTPAT